MTEDVEAVLARTVRQLAPLFESKEAPWPQDELDALHVKGTQLKLSLQEEPQPGRRGLLAVAMGLSLHAETPMTTTPEKMELTRGAGGTKAWRVNGSPPSDTAAVAPGHCVSSRPLVPVAATTS